MDMSWLCIDPLWVWIDHLLIWLDMLAKILGITREIVKQIRPFAVLYALMVTAHLLELHWMITVIYACLSIAALACD
jgi:hypothetical protein